MVGIGVATEGSGSDSAVLSAGAGTGPWVSRASRYNNKFQYLSQTDESLQVL